MSRGYNGNTEFYQKAKNSTLSLKDIFSDVFHKHAKEDGEKLFMAGTSATTPCPSTMLQEWNKPWLFMRVLAAGFIFLILLYSMFSMGLGVYAISPFALVGAAIVPVAILLLYWEMNIPRNVPIYEAVIMLFAGGCISLILTGFILSFTGDYPAYYAAFTEEPAKLLALCIFIRKRNRNYILNGVLIGGAIGAGFAMIETAGYFWDSSFDLNVLIGRGLGSPGGHVAWAAIYGGALAMVKGNKPLKIEHFFHMDFLKYFLAAIALHFTWNYYPLTLFDLPLYGDVKMLLLTIIAWLLLLNIIKKGVQQVLKMTSNHGSDMEAVALTKPELYGITGIYTGHSIPLSGGQIVFGRDPSTCNIIFPKETAGISRKHCTITSDGKNIWLCDDGSSNGTYLHSGEKLQAGTRIQLHKGQKFYLASIDTMFELR